MLGLRARGATPLFVTAAVQRPSSGLPGRVPFGQILGVYRNSIEAHAAGVRARSFLTDPWVLLIAELPREAAARAAGWSDSEPEDFESDSSEHTEIEPEAEPSPRGD